MPEGKFASTVVGMTVMLLTRTAAANVPEAAVVKLTTDVALISPVAGSRCATAVTYVVLAVRPVMTVSVDPANNVATRYGSQLLGATEPGAIKTSIGSSVLPFVHDNSTAVARTVPVASALGATHASSCTEAHDVHADGRNSGRTVRIRTQTLLPNVNAGNSTLAVGICPAAYSVKNVPAVVGVPEPVAYSTSTPAGMALRFAPVPAFVTVKLAMARGLMVSLATVNVGAVDNCAAGPTSTNLSNGPVGVSSRRTTCATRAPSVLSPMR
jgi:hypothetical protein